MNALSAYLEDGDRVSGWLINYSARFIADLGALQADAGFFGSVGEVGVHMGRLFILLKLLAAPGERTFAIDVFDASLNQDQSGYGDYNEFLRNVKQWTGSTENIQVIAKSSLTVEPEEVINVSGKARLISIDGGHTPECANNDIKLADSVLLPCGVAIIDDFFNESWPGVAAGVSRYVLLNEGDLRPFAITPNKLYFARPEYHQKYKTGMRELQTADFEKTSVMFGSNIDLYGSKYSNNYALKKRLRRNPITRNLLRFSPISRYLRD